MTSFALKIIALITMFCDHFGDAFLGHFSIFNLIGRFAFPIFAFQISEGYIHTKNLKKYLYRLAVFTIIAQIPFYLFCQKFFNTTTLSINVFLTLFIGLTGIYFYDYTIKFFKRKSESIQNEKLLLFIPYLSKFIGIVIVILLASMAESLNTDYGFWGVIVVFMFYVFKDKKLLTTVAFFILCIIKYLLPFIQSGFNILYILLALFTFLPIIFINAYNGKQGPKIKYLLYIFYPLHLLALYLI